MRFPQAFLKLPFTHGSGSRGQVRQADRRWICGHLEAGEGCRLGPDLRGRCQERAICQPKHTSEGWECCRAAADGGPCRPGPLPDGACCEPPRKCRPQRTSRARRELVSKWLAALSLAVIALTVSYAADLQYLMPGPLSGVHSTLRECKSCHSSISEGKLGWIRAAISPANPRVDSLTCLTCHKTGASALFPHGQPPEKLARSTKRLRSTTSHAAPLSARVRNSLFPFKKAFSEGVFCATCHKEHMGKTGLNGMAEIRCQTCHTVQFNRFGTDHPDFGNYPFKRRTRIFFDHTSHFGEHFGKTRSENAALASSIPGVCADCHTSRADRGHMAVKPFQKVCSACHINQIVGTERAVGPKGVPVLSLPGVDIETLREKKAAIGQWPAASEAEITPFMKLMIGRDAVRKKLVDAIGKLDLLDLSEASKQDIANVERFVWEVKFLIYALATVKQSVVLKKLLASTGAKIEPSLISKLIASLPRDVLSGVRRDWLAGLADEIAKYRSGEKVPTSASPAPDTSAPGPDSGKSQKVQTKRAVPVALDAETWAEFGGWYRQDYTIFYRPTGHADRFFRAWLDFAGRLHTSDAANLAAPVFELLTSKDAQGQCTKCHSVDKTGTGGRRVNWSPSAPENKVGRFTRFVHEPHFKIVGKQGCLTCHALNNKADYQKSYKALDPALFSSNFKPVKRSTCVDCHKQNAARQDCLLCHTYHVNKIVTPILKTKVPRK